MHRTDLARIYAEYIACLNRQDWQRLGAFVHDDVQHNGRALGVQGYREMLEQDYEQIPDLRFDVHTLVAEPPWVASRLLFEVSPRGEFLGLPVNGRKITFAENAFYRFHEGRIQQVWSVLDKAAIEAQLR